MAVAVAESKTCPACAETIKAQAVLCRFCGFDYRSLVKSPIPTPGIVAGTPASTTGSGYWSVAGILALAGSLIGAIGEFYDTVSPSAWHLFGSGKFLVDLGNGITYLQADVITALAAIWLLASSSHRRVASVLLVVLGAKYTLSGVGVLVSIKGSDLTPGAGIYLGLLSGLLVLGGGLVAWQGAWRSSEPTSEPS